MILVAEQSDVTMRQAIQIIERHRQRIVIGHPLWKAVETYKVDWQPAPGEFEHVETAKAEADNASDPLFTREALEPIYVGTIT